MSIEDEESQVSTVNRANTKPLLVENREGQALNDSIET